MCLSWIFFLAKRASWKSLSWIWTFGRTYWVSPSIWLEERRGVLILCHKSLTISENNWTQVFRMRFITAIYSSKKSLSFHPVKFYFHGIFKPLKTLYLLNHLYSIQEGTGYWVSASLQPHSHCQTSASSWTFLQNLTTYRAYSSKESWTLNPKTRSSSLAISIISFFLSFLGNRIMEAKFNKPWLPKAS